MFPYGAAAPEIDAVSVDEALALPDGSVAAGFVGWSQGLDPQQGCLERCEQLGGTLTPAGRRRQRGRRR